jgi:hypothetical protein
VHIQKWRTAHQRQLSPAEISYVQGLLTQSVNKVVQVTNREPSHEKFTLTIKWISKISSSIWYSKV